MASDPTFSTNIQRFGARIEAQTGYPALAAVAVAQGCEETGYGQSVWQPYNYTNIGNTDQNPQGGPGYGSPEAAADGYLAFLTAGPRYTNVLQAAAGGADVHTLASLLQQDGWATDSTYASKVAAAALNCPYVPAQQGASGQAPGGVPTWAWVAIAAGVALAVL